MKRLFKKAKQALDQGNERAARFAVLEELFHDFNRSRFQVYKMNFIRGIFFGLGSVLGGTVVIALLVWILSFFVSIPGIGESVEQVQETIRPRD